MIIDLVTYSVLAQCGNAQELNNHDQTTIRLYFDMNAQVYQNAFHHSSKNLPYAVCDIVLGPTRNVESTYKFYNSCYGWKILINQNPSSPCNKT